MQNATAERMSIKARDLADGLQEQGFSVTLESGPVEPVFVCKLDTVRIYVSPNGDFGIAGPGFVAAGCHMVHIHR